MNKKIIVAIFVLFLIPMFPFLRGDEINYSVYFSIFVLIFTVTKLFQKPILEFDANIVFWSWYLIITFISWDLTFLIKNYGFLTFPFTTVSFYIVMRYYFQISDYKLFFKLFIITAILESIIGISQSLWNYPIFQNVTNELFTSNRNYLAYFIPGLNTHVTHGYGTFEHFNGLSAFLGLIFPFAFGQWLNKKSKFNLITILVLFFGLYTTYSRGALIGVICGVSYILYFNSRNKLFIKIIFLLGGVGLMLMSSYLIDYYNSTQNFTIREYTWLFAFEKAMQNPIKIIYGYGPFYFRETLLGLLGTITNLHSGQLQFLLELGVIGFFLLLKIFNDSLKNIKIFNNNKSLIAINGCIIAFFIHQLFDNSFFSLNGTLWFALVAISMTINGTDLFNENNLHSNTGTQP